MVIAFRGMIFTLAWMACCLPSLAREPVQVPLPKIPEGTVKAFGVAVSEGKYEVLWQALPATYQADIKTVLTAFAKKMDSERWAQLNKVLGKASKVLTDKADFIVGSAPFQKNMEGSSLKPEDAKKYFAGFGGILAEFQSSTVTLADVEKLDVEKLLANVGPRFKELSDLSSTLGFPVAAHQWTELHKAEIRIREITTDTAKVEIIRAAGKKELLELVRVEGKWVPKDIADEWQAKISEALKYIDRLNFQGEENQPAFIFPDLMDLMNGVLDTFLNAKTQAEFDAVVNGILPLIQPKNLGGPAAIQQRKPLPQP